MIEVAGLHKQYGSVEAVVDLSFEVAQGSVVGFLGPNGAGKSTTLRILAGFLSATRGSVRIGGHDVAVHRDLAIRQLGYMPETSPLYPEMRVSEYLRFRAELKGIARGARKREIAAAVAAAHLESMENVRIGHLSKGYRQRVALADALLGSPPLLILDEPTAGLDPNQMGQVRQLVRRLAKEHTILLSTHILSEVEATCDRAIVIDRGRLVASGTVAELRAQQAPAAIDVVLTGDRKKALSLLRELPGVASARRQGDVAEDERTPSTLRIKVGKADDLGEMSERLVKALVEGGLNVRQVAPVAASLEDVFSQLTEPRQQRDDTAEVA